MDKVSVKLSVYFEEPFWVGVLERIEDGKLYAEKVTFGAEPKEYEVKATCEVLDMKTSTDKEFLS